MKGFMFLTAVLWLGFATLVLFLLPDYKNAFDLAIICSQVWAVGSLLCKQGEGK